MKMRGKTEQRDVFVKRTRAARDCQCVVGSEPLAESYQTTTRTGQTQLETRVPYGRRICRECSQSQRETELVVGDRGPVWWLSKSVFEVCYKTEAM